MARTIGWTLLAAILALGGAGLVAQLTHPPGDLQRAELTWASDHALAQQLDGLGSRLVDVGALVDALADDAKAALIAVSSGDAAALKSALDDGTRRTTTIEATVAQLRGSLAGLPDPATASSTQYSNATLVRLAALAAALDSVGGLSDLWASVAAKSTEASSLIVAIQLHDTTLASAAADGVKAQYAPAIELCNQSLAILGQISTLRADFVQAGAVTVLDAWIASHLRYDKALVALYAALKASGGVRNPTVDAAYREQALALAELPADNRQIVVIVAEVAQGGLNQAAVALDGARGLIDEAIAEAAASPAPGVPS